MDKIPSTAWIQKESAPTWEEISPELAWDGVLRDLYVFGTSAGDWDKLIQALRETSFAVELWRGDVLIDLPQSLQPYFANHAQEPVLLLKIHVAGVAIHSHFFTESEIEFAIDPREINDQQRLDTLVAFMQFVANTLEKEVVLTYENMPTHVIVRMGATNA